MRGLMGFHAELLFIFFSIAFSLHVPTEVEQPPTITIQSEKSIVAMAFDDNFTLTCEATGTPKPVFYWTKDGLNFNPRNDLRLKNFEHSGSFVIPNNKYLAEYQGKYRCYASNKLGVAMSEETHFIVPMSPKFPKEIIEPAVVKEGDPVVLECNPPKGIPPRHLYWMTIGLKHISQDERVSMGLNGNLYFSNVLAKDSHSDYSCFASFPKIRTIVQKTAMAIVVMSSNSSGETDVTISNRKPNLLVPSGDLSQIYLVQGQDLEIECIAEGFPTPIIEWMKVGVKLPKRSNIKNHRKWLVITNVTEEDSGKYMCKAKNSAGEAVHFFDIIIEAPPYWVQEPVKSQVVSIGSEVHINCHASGKPPPTITWMRNGEPLQEFSSSHIRVLHDTVILYRAQENNTAVYQCEVSNKHGTLLSNSNIMVMNLPPLILTQNSVKYSVVGGNSVIMDCKVFSSPPADIVWRKEGLEVSLVGKRFFLHKNGSLQIHTTKVEDKGKYTCFVSNSEGNSSINAKLHIKDPTKILTPPRDININRGSMAELLCKVQYDHSLTDELKILWQKDGEEITNYTEDSRFYIDEGILQINNVSHSDKGLYTCIARTSLDQDTASAYVTVLDVPDPPIDLTLSDLRDRSVKLHWMPANDHNSHITEYIIEFEENHWEPGKWRPLLRVSGYQNSAPLSLYGHINYQFSVSAVNAVGRGHRSKPSERYMTPPAAPDRNPENIKIEGHTPRQMDITWEPLLPIEHNGPGLEYKLSYRQMGVEESWTEKMVTRHSFIVKDTPTFVPYEVKVQAHNNYGWAVEPNVVIGYSGEDSPGAAPEDVHVEVLNSTLLRVSWSPVQQAQLRGRLKGYNVQWWRTQSLLTSTEVPAEKQFLIIPGNQSHTLVPGLKPFSQYHLTVNVFNRKGSGPNSKLLMFTTPEGVPESPPVLKATNTQANSITLVWAPPLEANGFLTGYELQYQISNDTLDVGEGEVYRVNISGPDTTQWVLHDLKAASGYKFYLSACTLVGCGPAISEGGSTVPVAYAVAHDKISSKSWVIGIMCAVALLTLVVLIACFVTKNKSGNYAVKDKEEMRSHLESKGMNDETSCEYSDSDEKPLKNSRLTLVGDNKGDSSSMDSSVEYGNEDCEFNEDGSFIGEYVGYKRRLSMDLTV